MENNGIKYLLYIIVVAVIALLLTIFSFEFSASATTKSLEILVDVNTALLAFMAVIAIFTFTAINSNLLNIENKIGLLKIDEDNDIKKLDLPIKFEENLDDCRKRQSPEARNLINQKYELKKLDLKTQQKILKSKHDKAILYLGLAVVFFIASILLLLLNIEREPMNSTWVKFAITAFICGIFTMFYQILLLTK